MSNRPVLGVDFGGVINDGSGHPSGDDTIFLTGGYDEAMQTPVMAGAILALQRLNDLFQGRVWVISKCGPRIQQRTEQWLDYHHFFEQTAISAAQVRFYRQRPEKAIHCAELGVTHFVDDRNDVLEHLAGVVDHRYLFGERSPTVPPGTTRVRSWSEAEEQIRSTLESVPHNNF
jgi:hypothetical protein